jgi:protein-disulfide isomerase
MGNPKAKLKLVEYGSLACPHCRHFEQTGYKPLVQGYVRDRPRQLRVPEPAPERPDLAVSLLAHCAGPAGFFAMSQVVYATQPQWFEKVGAVTDAQRAEMEKMTDQQRIARMGEIAGFPQIAGRFGVHGAACASVPCRSKGVGKADQDDQGGGGCGHHPHADLPDQRQGLRTLRPGSNWSRS